MSNFFERKLGQPQQQPRGIVVPPQQPQVVVPPGYQLVPINPQQQQQQQQPVYQPQPIDTKLKYLEFARLHDGEKISKYWQGGEATKLEGNLSCPQCGSPTGYTTYSSTMMHGTRPRPHCFECGYNGLFQQADQANWTTA